MNPLHAHRVRPGAAFALATAIACFTASLVALPAAPLYAQQPTPPADTAAAIAAMRDFHAACTRDGGALWGRTLCGPIVLADPDSRVAVASEQPPGGSFTRQGDVWIGRMPEGIPLANTSLKWVDREWATIRLPLTGDRFARVALLAHESFHRIQDALGLRGADALNPHLDERDGRYWLRLELRALAAALRARDAATARRAAGDAVLFRQRRYALYPGADTLETALELQEGLAEYTGERLAMQATGLGPARVADATRDFESRPTYVRSLGYGTGPALGLLLDRWAPGWRTRLRTQGFAAQLAHALRFTPPADLAAAADERAAAYDGATLATEEAARDAARQQRLAEYRARLVAGPVLVLRQQALSRAFNPNTLVAFPGEGTVYPTGTFGADWGKLEVTEGGALVAPDFTTVRVAASGASATPADSAGATIRGPGWTLTLAPGWRLVADARAGDWTAAPR